MTQAILSLLTGKTTELKPSFYEKTQQFLKDKAITPTEWTMLDPRHAAEMAIDYDDDLWGLQHELSLILQDDPVDCAILPAQNRQKKLLIADMDSTMITVECIDELADFIGMKDKVAVITEKAMRGELDFEAALDERVALLKGLPLSSLEECYLNRVHFTEGAQALVQTMRGQGAFCLLVSGGFTFFTEKVAHHCGFHLQHGNILQHNNVALTGKVARPILGKQAKLDNLIHYAQKHQLDLSETLAVGDGANDLAMITAAGLGVAFHAKPAVAAAARVSLNHADLTGLLYLQGYNSSQFTEGTVWTKCG